MTSQTARRSKRHTRCKQAGDGGWGEGEGYGGGKPVRSSRSQDGGAQRRHRASARRRSIGKPKATERRAALPSVQLRAELGCQEERIESTGDACRLRRSFLSTVYLVRLAIPTMQGTPTRVTVLTCNADRSETEQRLRARAATRRAAPLSACHLCARSTAQGARQHRARCN